MLELKPSTSRRTTLLEAIAVNREEAPHSNFLAWLLGSQGPLTDFWLLKAVLHCAAPSMEWPGFPHSVLSEVALESERPPVSVHSKRLSRA